MWWRLHASLWPAYLAALWDRYAVSVSNVTLGFAAWTLATASALPLAQAAPTAQLIANEAPVSFSSGEILVIAGMLGAVIAALSLVFRLLLQSQANQLKDAKDRIVVLDAQLVVERAHVVTILENAAAATLAASESAAKEARAIEVAAEIRARLQTSEKLRESGA